MDKPAFLLVAMAMLVAMSMFNPTHSKLLKVILKSVISQEIHDVFMGFFYGFHGFPMVFHGFSWFFYGFSYGFLSPTSGRRVDLRGDRRPPPWGLPEVSLIWAPWERKKNIPAVQEICCIHMIYIYML